MPESAPSRVDVGVDDCGHPAILEAARELDDPDLSRLAPAFDGDTALPRIDADDDPPG